MQGNQNLGEEVLRAVAGKPAGVSTEEICDRLGVAPQQLGDVFEALKEQRQIFGFAGVWVGGAEYDCMTERVIESLAEMQQADRKRIGFTEQELQSQVGITWSSKQFNRLVAQLELEKKLERFGAELRVVGSSYVLSQKQRMLLDKVVEVMDRCGASAPPPHQIAAELGVPEQAVSEIVRLGVASGDLARLDFDLVYSHQTLKQLLAEARGMNQPFTVAEFRDRTQSSRRYALAILGYFDKTGMTKREGDARRASQANGRE